jgi:hypothetical protein
MSTPHRTILLCALAGASAAACSTLIGDFNLAAGAGVDGGNGSPDATTGNDGSTPPSNDGGGQGTPDANGPGTDACGGGGCADVSCPSNETACATGCVNTTSSAANCGACEHDCGGTGSQCANSVCLPQTLITGIDAPTGFAVDATSIYFTVDNLLKSCPVTGCVQGGTQLGTYSNMSTLAVVGSTLTFVGTGDVGNHPNSSLYTCALPGCASPTIVQASGIAGGFTGSVVAGADLYFMWLAAASAPQTSTLSQCQGVSATGCQKLVSISSEQAAPLAADGSNVYFSCTDTDAGYGGPYGIGYCAGGAACANPTLIPSGTGTPPAATFMALVGGTVYFVGARDLGTGGTLYSCPVTGCSAGPASLDKEDLSITSFTADSSGMYFTGTQGSNPGVFTCPLAGCGSGGPQEIVPQQSFPAFVTTDANFVYWVNEGADGGTGGASIMRLAKP